MMKTWAIVGGLLLGWAAAAEAGPLNLGHVGADAKWVAHADVDGMRSSAVVQKFYDQCVKSDPAAGKCFDKIRQEWGIDLRTDLHGMTFYGTKYGPQHGTLIVYTQVDKEQMLKKAQSAPDHGTVKYGDYEIHTWTDGKGTKRAHQAAGAFFKPDVLVFANSVDRLKTALDVLGGKSPSLAGKGSPLAAKCPEGTLFLARAVGLDTAKLPGEPAFLKAIKQLNYAEGEHGGHWFGHLNVTADSSSSAQDLKQVLEGFLAMISLHFHDQPSVAKLLKKTEVKVEGTMVRMAFEAPVDQVNAEAPAICKALKQHLERHAAMHHGAKQEGKKHEGKKEGKEVKKESKPHSAAGEKPHK